MKKISEMTVKKHLDSLHERKESGESLSSIEAANKTSEVFNAFITESNQCIALAVTLLTMTAGSLSQIAKVKQQCDECSELISAMVSKDVTAE